MHHIYLCPLGMRTVTAQPHSREYVNAAARRLIAKLLERQHPIAEHFATICLSTTTTRNVLGLFWCICICIHWIQYSSRLASIYLPVCSAHVPARLFHTSPGRCGAGKCDLLRARLCARATCKDFALEFSTLSHASRNDAQIYAVFVRQQRRLCPYAPWE